MEIKHQSDKMRFCVEVDGYLARVDYRIKDCALGIRHTVVPDEIGGRGIASSLVRAAYDYAVAQGLVPVATCSYAVKWLEKHPEYKGRVGEDYGGENSCAF